MVVYIASHSPLPLIPWQKVAGDFIFREKELLIIDYEAVLACTTP